MIRRPMKEIRNLWLRKSVVNYLDQGGNREQRSRLRSIELGNCGDDIVQGVAFLILAVLSDTIHHAPLLIEQHGKTGKGIIVGLSCLCETRKHAFFLRPSSDPGLQACQTEPCVD